MDQDADTLAHEGRIDLDPPCNEGAPEGTGAIEARFVQYPGCQQLTVWLPRDGRGGYTGWRCVAADGSVAAQGDVRDALSGSVQMLFDTLAWPPGRWRLEIAHADGWRHVLPLHKQPEGAPEAPASAPAAAPAASASAGSEGIVYRDGFGRVIVDEERLFRERAHALLVQRLTRKVTYAGYHRAGTYTYTEGALQIRFGQEMGGGGCKAVIDLPRPERWEAETGVPLSRRDEIVDFVAQQAQRDFGSRCEIRDDSIAVF